jgi:uncharacterized protein (DUF305 family)
MEHGGSGGGSSESAQASQRETTGAMAGTDHSEMEMGETTGSSTGMEGMDHSSMDHGEMSSEDMAAMSQQMVMPNGKYSDEAFIDAMVPHHEGAVEMAQVALKRAEHPEIRRLARDIVSSQEREIKQLGGIREREYGSAKSPMQMSEQDMQAMGMSDPEQLAQARPFDKAFIDDMIPHHESAIAMAEVARRETNDPEIRRIASDIVSAQEREIGKMKQWRQQWYPEG